MSAPESLPLLHLGGVCGFVGTGFPGVASLADEALWARGLVRMLVVDFAELRTLAAGIDDRIEEIERLLADLRARVEGLTELWEGSASEGFRSAQAGWSAAAGDLPVRLAGLRDLVVTAHDNHAGAVRHNERIWRV